MPEKSIERWLADLEADEAAKRAALDGLWRLGPEDHDAVPALTAALGVGRGDLRVLAARFLSLVGPGATEAVPALVRSLDQEDRDLSKWSADALGRVGAAAAVAVPRLRELAQDDDRWVRVLAQGALLKLTTSPDLVAALVSTKEADDIALQCWGLSLLIDVVDKYEEVLPALLGYLPHHYDPHIEDIGLCLAARPRARQPLLRALTTGSDWVRRNAARVLGCQASPADELVAPLAAALSDPFADARWSAAGALAELHAGRTDVRSALPAIRRAVDDDDSENVRYVCRELLRALADPSSAQG